MTEATGGILMTPPGKYKDDSLGIPLPGVETKLSEEGELWIRGIYIFDEYLNPPEGVEPRNSEGWFETGDIMIRDEEGAYTIIDRKKEIYKNIKGQTVAPQKIENYFREFKSLKHIYLVGDYREYNTVLIVPDYDFSDGYLRQLSPAEFRDFFSSLIVSVNRFLAPYERIVDFAVLDKDFDPEKELTPKGTYRRKIIERNHKEIIDKLYSNPWLSLSDGEVEIRLPNWYLRDRGITGYELEFSGKRLYHKQNNESIRLEYDKEGQELILGNFFYRLDRPLVDFA
jgi:long-subunit acyl-CoA synthetase (AMP-forming)